MFTGLITDTAPITHMSDHQLIVNVPIDTSSIDIGASISVSGCCLTVVEKNHQQLTFDLNPETLSKTNFSHLCVNDIVNVERALHMGQPLDGHLVSGHIDCVGQIEEIRKQDDSHHIAISFPLDFHKWVIEKGSIALDGISLTINKVESTKIYVCIIPHTWSVTNLRKKKPGDKVNIEFDMMAKFFEKQAKPYFAKLNKEINR